MRKKFCPIIFILSLLMLSSCAMGTGSDSITCSDVLFMMYIDGDNDLNNISWANVSLAQRGLMNISSNASVTVLVLVDGKHSYPGRTDGSEKSFLYKLGPDSSIDYSNSVSWVYNGGSHEVDMSSGQTLYNFLNWANSRFSAGKTILAMQNHGGGPYNELNSSLTGQTSARTLCWDETTGTKTYLTTTDVARAINLTFGKIDMLVEDVCLQCSIEEIYGLQDAVHYLVASPNTTYGNTYNYDKIIPYISTGASIADIGKKFVDYNMETCRNKTLTSNKANAPTCMELSLTLVDCSKKSELAEIKSLTSKLAEELLADSQNKDIYTSLCIGKLQYSEDRFYGFSYSASYVYTQDLGVMAYMLANYTQDASDNVKTAAAGLYNKLHDSGPIVYGWAGGSEHSWYYSGDSSYGPDDTNLSFFKINDGKCPWGISITCGRKDVKVPLNSYSSWSAFAKDNKWADLLVNWKNTVE